MASSVGTSEIIETKDELNLVPHTRRLSPISIKPGVDEKDRKMHSRPAEDELNRLIDAIDLRASSKVLGPSHQMGVDLFQKNTLKKPVGVGVGMARSSGIGISESVTLKQALRRLCISQASEMAAMKRFSKPSGISSVSEAGTIKRLYAAVVVQAKDSGQSLDEEQGNLLEISLVPEKVVFKKCEPRSEFYEASSAEVSSQPVLSCPHIAATSAIKLMKPKIRDVIASNVGAEATAKKMKPKVQDVIVHTSADAFGKLSAGAETVVKGKLNSPPSVSSSKTGGESSKPHASPRLIRPTFRNKNCPKKKGRDESTSAPVCSSKCNEVDKVGMVPSKSKLGLQKESASTGSGDLVVLRKKDCKPEIHPYSGNVNRVLGVKTSEGTRTREKGECSQSSKSSMGDYSSSTSISDESNQSGSSGHGCRPHMSNDVRWMAIRHVEMQQGSIGLHNFKLLKRLGCGDIGTVYLAELIGSDCLFALKVMDNEFLLSRKKMLRAQTEREILQILDHPFLPTLYTYFTTDNLSCLVMEYCPGGDLHVLRQKQLGRSFSEPAARFYVAEVLLALEYLHMLGVVYRDLKPENILVREDGHIMLSDFDLSLRCAVSPTLLRSSSLSVEEPTKKLSGPCSESSCIDPTCLHPSWVQVSCFTPRLVSSSGTKTRKPKTDQASQVTPLPQLVAEPTEARSNSFVGTHEYLAPEIIKGEGHGASVDWWTFGIFLYELLFGRTPFKGPGNEETLANVVTQSLSFPESPVVSFHARDLIRGLLSKDPENRLGSVRGAAEIKQHPFFEGLNWALIRCATPPETPVPYDLRVPVQVAKKKEGKCLEFRANGENVELELF